MSSSQKTEVFKTRNQQWLSRGPTQSLRRSRKREGTNRK